MLFLLLTTAFSFIYAESNENSLRFAIWNNSNTAFVNSDGEISGFEPDLIRALEKYLPQPIEFKIYDNKKASLQALRNNEVDAIMSCPYIADLDDDFEANSLMVRHVDSILCSASTTYAYQEYDAMKNRTIGYLNRSEIVDPILKYINDKIENPIMIGFDSEQELRDAVETQQVDLGVLGSGDINDNLHILDRFLALPTYYVTRKGESDVLNSALSSLFNNSYDLYSTIYFNYYPRTIVSEFTRKELDYIKSNPNISVVSGVDREVFSSFAKNGQPIGIFPAIINEVNNVSGLKMRLIPNEDGKSSAEMLKSGEATFAIDLDCFKGTSIANELIYCDSFMKVPMQFVIKLPTTLDKEEARTIVLSDENSPADKYIKANFPNWKLVYEESLQKRYDLVLSGKVDALIDSSYNFNYLKAKSKYQNLARAPAIVSYAAEVNVVIKDNEDGFILSNIVNKSISHFNKKMLNDITEKNVSGIVYTPTLYDYINFHRSEYLIILVVLIVLLSVMFILLNHQRRKNLEKTNDELIKAEQEAVDANKAKGLFLARMSHDMRTPLGAVISLSEFGMKEATSEDVKSYFVDIDESALYLLSLMDDILDTQKLLSDDFDFTYSVVNFCKIINRVKTLTMNKVVEKNIEISINGNCKDLKNRIYADDKRLTQIFVNILNNAIKYTNPGGKIIWNVNYKNLDDDKILIFTQIQDTGVGMSEDFVNNQLFKPFSKEENSLSKLEGGTGLGLSICKKLIDQMDGSIVCESEIGKGTTFTIELILQTVKGEESKKIIVENSDEDLNYNKEGFVGKKILVCDDTEINIKIVKKILESKQFIVDTAYNGQEAVNKVKINYYDAVLMDVRMPVLDGLEATKQIRTFNQDILIIAYSANAYSDDIEKSLAAGMDAHIAKPLDSNKLFKILKDEMAKR
ncbi:MAG: response regulator [Sphaerochaeta sp.]